MVFGGTAGGHIQLNEETLWSGGPRDTNNPEALRRLLFEGRPAAASASAPDTLHLRGHLDGGKGLAFCAALRALPEGGASKAGGGRIEVGGADAVTLLLSVATAYGGGDPEATCRRQLAAAARPYRALLAEHTADYRRLFRRVSLDLGGEDR